MADQISAHAVRARVQDELDAMHYPVSVHLTEGKTGWPLVAVTGRAGESTVVLGEFDVEPLLTPSVESMSSVIINGVRALYDEQIERIDRNPGEA